MSRHSSSGAEWQATRLRVLERDNWECVYCGAEATEVDHVVPRAAGGTDDEDNLVASCKSDNASKGARVLTRRAFIAPEFDVSRVA